MAIRISTPIVERLQADGLLPPDCRLVELVITPGSAMILRFEVLVTDERLRQLGGALLALADEITPAAPGA
jgi:hypothetical protein